MLHLLHALLATARSSLKPQRELAVENLALRQQLAILQRKAKRPKLTKWDSDCDDGNPCTRDDREYYFRGPYEGFSFCGPEFHACSYMRVDDGAQCEVDEQSGVCESGRLRLEEETSEPGLDGSV